MTEEQREVTRAMVVGLLFWACVGAAAYAAWWSR
jgi:hypothetical protein